MTWLWDFIKGFWRAAKNASEWQMWTTETPETDDIKWYVQWADWTITGITYDESKSWWESAWDTVWNAAWIAWNFLTNMYDNAPTLWIITWTGAWDKQKVDDELLGLQYNWKDATLDERNQYMDYMSQFQYLSGLQNRTIADELNLATVQNEMSKYTVPDYEDDWEWDWENTWLGKLMPDSWRNSAALNHTKRKHIDNNDIIDIVSKNEKIYNYFNSLSPEQIANPRAEEWIRYLTETEMQKKQKQTEVDDIVNNRIDEVVQKALNDPNFKITGREWEIINEDTVRWLLEKWMDVDGISTVIESYKNLYKKLDDVETPILKQQIQQKLEGMVDMLYFQFAADDPSSKDAFFEFVEQNGNPLELNLTERYDEYNDYEKGLVESINSLFGLIPLWYKDYWLFSANDWCDKADALSRMINVSKSWYLGRAWNLFMLTSTQVTWLFQVAVDWIIWSIDAAWQYLRTWELTYGDYKAYLYWTQTPDVFTVKEKFQDWAVPESWPKKYWILIYESLWLVDDLIATYYTMWASLPVKAATAEKIVKIIPKVEKAAEKWAKVVNAVNKTAKTIDKAEDVASAATKTTKVAWATEKAATAGKVAATTEKVVETTEKVATTAEKTAAAWEATESIVTWAQKAWEAYTKWSFIQRTKDAAWRIVQRWKDSRAAKTALKTDIASAGNQAQIWFSNWAKLLWENFARWVAEETFTSLWFQWMTSYDYEDTDLVLDLAWAAFSGFLRTKEFVNKMWMMKYQAVSKNKVWWIWYLREALWVSDDAVDWILKKLTDADLEDLWWAVKKSMEDLVWTWELLTKKWFQSKISKLSSTSRQWINSIIWELVKWADADLIKKLKNSTNQKYNSMVKAVQKKWPDWKMHTTWTWNRPAGMSDKEWYKRVNKARTKAYSPGGLDWKSSYVAKINTIKQYTKRNLPAILWRDSAGRSKYVEKVNWKWQFKKSVDQKTRDRLYQQMLYKRLKESGITIRNWQKTFKKEYDIRAQRSKVFQNLYNAWIWDEVENPLWPIGQRLAIYVNDYLAAKWYWKDALVRWLDWFGAAVSQAFKRWLKEYRHVWDYRDLTLKEIRQNIILFWKTFDEKINKEFMIKAKVFNENWMLRDSKDMLINKPFEEARKENPDLSYMWVVMFNKIISDETLTDVQKEIKIRTYTWDPRDAWRLENEFYWIVNWSLHFGKPVWTKVFNDSFEEKKLMWTSWKIYIKVSDLSKEDAIKLHWEGNMFDKRVWPNQDWVIELEYEVIWESIVSWREKKEWTKTNYITRRVYELRYRPNPDSKWYAVWEIYTFANPIYKKWMDPNMAYWETRYMSIQLTWEEYKDLSFETADFSIYRWSEDQVIYDYDLNRNIDTSKIDQYVPDAEFDPLQKVKNKRTTQIKAWNDVANHVYWEWDWSVESWEKFTKMIPGRTDKVPYEYYKAVMWIWTAPEFRKHKFNLLLNMMYNDWITQTEAGMKINMNNRHQFRSTSFTIEYTGYETYTPKKWRPYPKRVRKSDWYVPSDWELVVWTRNSWVVIIQKDPNWAPKAYQYVRKEWAPWYNLYEMNDLALEKPVWSFALWWKDLVAHLYNGKNRERVLWSMEFVSPISSKGQEVDIDAMKKVAQDSVDDTVKYSDLDATIKIDNADASMYDEIYREMYWTDMPVREKIALRSQKWMTPERYFNQIVDKFLNSRFWKYFWVSKNSTWKDAARQIRWANQVVWEIQEYLKNVETTLTDEQLVNIVSEYVWRLVANWWEKFELSEVEKEIRRMMYPHNWNYLDLDRFISLVQYRDYWKIAARKESKAYELLRKRRDRILAYRLKTNDLSWMDDDIKEFLIDRFYRDWWFFRTEKELTQDIIEHPEEYRQILDEFANKFKNEFDMADTSELDKEIDELDKKIKELEDSLPTSKPKKVSWPESKAKKAYTWEVLHSVLQWELDSVYRQMEEVAQKLTETTDPEEIELLTKQYNDLKAKATELEEWNRLYKETREYRTQIWNADAITPEQWQKIVDREVTWRPAGYVPHKMSTREINQRLAQIKSKLPNVRIWRYDPETWTIITDILDPVEQARLSTQLNRIAEDIKNGNATAAHVREMWAIVINPSMLNEMDIWHEWFHEAIRLVWFDWFDKRVRKVYDQAWAKFQKEIEANAENLWYDKLYDWKYTIDWYRDMITEEWLAERFAEFVNWKYYEEYSMNRWGFLYNFFTELWRRIQNMFSDTEIVDLFEDIYKWVDQNDAMKVSFNASNVDWWDIAYRSISNDWLNYIQVEYSDPNSNTPKIQFWDILWLQKWIDDYWNITDTWVQLQMLHDIVQRAWWDKDALVMLSEDFATRWNFLWARPVTVTLPNWNEVQTSFLDIFESFVDSVRNAKVDDMIDKIYWWPTSELETWIDDVLLRTWWNFDNIEHTWLLFNEQMNPKTGKQMDDYPITAQLFKNDKWWITFKLYANWNEIHSTVTTPENIWALRESIAQNLANWITEKRKLTRILDAAVAANSKLLLWSISLDDFAQKTNKFVNIWWSIVAANDAVRVMWDVLWQSIQDNYTIITNADFSDIPFKIKMLADFLYKNYLYDRLIPHSWNSWIKRNIFNGLFEKKRMNTQFAIKHIVDLIEPFKDLNRFVEWWVWSDPAGWVVVNFSFKIWLHKRTIWRHFKDVDEARMTLQNLVDTNTLTQERADSFFKVNEDWTLWMAKNYDKADTWNVSIFALRDWEYSQYQRSKQWWNYIWRNFKQNYRERYNNSPKTWDWELDIRYHVAWTNKKDVPFIWQDWTKQHVSQELDMIRLDDYMDWAMIPAWFNQDDYYVYLFWQDKIPVIIDKKDPGFMVTKWMNKTEFEKLAQRWYWIWSSSAISKEWNWSWWDVTMIWKKIIPDFKDVLYWGESTIWLWDFWSPMWSNLLNARFFMVLDNIKENIPRSVLEKLNDTDEWWLEYRLKNDRDLRDIFIEFDINLAGDKERDQFVDSLCKDVDEYRETWEVSFESRYGPNWWWIALWDQLRPGWWEIDFTIFEDQFLNRKQIWWMLPKYFEDNVIDFYKNNPDTLKYILNDLYWWKIANAWHRNVMKPSYISTEVINLLNDQQHKILWEFYDANIPYSNRFLEYMSEPSSREDMLKHPNEYQWRKPNSEWFLDVFYVREWFNRWMKRLHPDEVYELNDADIEKLLSYYSIKNYKWEHNYYEIYNTDLDVSDYRWLVVKSEDIPDYRWTLRVAWYEVVVAPLDATKEDLEAMARQVSSKWKWFVIIPAWEDWVPLIDVNEINRVNYRSARNWTSDDQLKAAKEIGLNSPITMDSYEKHVEDIERVMDINKKYWITVDKWSPDQLKRLNKLSNWRSEKAPYDFVQQKLSLWHEREELRKLRKRSIELRWWRDYKKKRRENFQSSEIYKTVDWIKDALEKNKKAIEAVKAAKANPDVVKASKPTVSDKISEAISKRDTTTAVPPIATLTNWFTTSNKNMRNSIGKQYPDTAYSKEELALWKKERKAFYVTPLSTSDPHIYWEIDAWDDIVFWAEDSDTLKTWDTWAKKNWYVKVYERPWEWQNIIYYTRVDDVSEVEDTIDKTVLSDKKDLTSNPKKYEQGRESTTKNDWISNWTKWQDNIWSSKENGDSVSSIDEFLQEVNKERELESVREERVLKQIEKELSNPVVWDEIYDTWAKFIKRTLKSKAETFESFSDRVRKDLDDFQAKEIELNDDELKFLRSIKARIIKAQEHEQNIWTVFWWTKEVTDPVKKNRQSIAVDAEKEKIRLDIQQHYDWDQFQASDLYDSLEASTSTEMAYTKTELKRIERLEKAELRRMNKIQDKVLKWDYSWFIDQKNLRHRANKRENWKPQEQDVQSVISSWTTSTHVCS